MVNTTPEFTSILYDATAYPGGFTAEVGKINRIDGTNLPDANLPAGTAGAQIGFYIVGAGGGLFEIEPFLGDTINGGTPELDIERPIAGQFVMLEFSATELDWAVLSNTAQVALPFTSTLYTAPFTAEVGKINRVDGTVVALAIALPLGVDGDVIGFLNEYGMNGSMVVTPDVGGPDFIFIPGNPVYTIKQPSVPAPIVSILRFNGSTKIWLPEDVFQWALGSNPRFIPTSTFAGRPNGAAMFDNSLLASVGVGNDIAALVIGEGELVGRPVGSDLSSMTPSGVRAMLGLDFGTYTPVISNISNLSPVVASVAQWLRIGNVVTVSGKLVVDAIAAAAASLQMSLPVASNFTAEEQCGGTASTGAETAAIGADSGTDLAFMDWVAVNTAAVAMRYTFTYQIL